MYITLLTVGAATVAAWRGSKKRRQRYRAAVQTIQASRMPVVAAGAKATRSSPDRELNRSLALSGGALGLIAGSSLVPVLLLPGIGLLLVSVVRTLRQVGRQLLQGKVGVTLLDSVAFVMPMLLHFWLLAALTGTFISGAGWLARRTERRSQEDLAALFRRQMPKAWVKHQGVLLEVPCETLQAGDRVWVDAGMTLPVDGIVVEGLGRVDQQALTGEARPVDKAMGDKVFAATLLLDGYLIIELQQAGSESAAADLVRLLDEVDQTRQDSQTRAQALIDRWVPPTLGLSALALATRSMNGALAVVYSSIGYPLRYAGPTSTLNYMRLGMERGILIRDGRALEKLAGVDLVVFDKTGTLTHSVPTVHRVTGIGRTPPLAVLGLAAAAEQHQSHPLAHAIVAAAEAAGIPLGQADTRQIRPGYGLQVEIDGQSVLVGSDRLLGVEGIDIGPYARTVAPQDIVVYVAVDGCLAGFIELAPALREEVPEIIGDLQAHGTQVVLLSGDRREPTRELAAELGLDGYFAEILPQEKSQVIQRFQDQGRRVCFIGDGINDAIALKRADVSVSLKGATAIAESAASILLLDGSLNHLPELFRLARASERNLQRAAILTTAAGTGSIAGVFLLGMGAASAMAFNAGVIGGCMINAFAPLLYRPAASSQSPQQTPGNAPRHSVPVLRQWPGELDDSQRSGPRRRHRQIH